MKTLLPIVLVALALCGCEAKVAPPKRTQAMPALSNNFPVVNLPYSLRQSNWLGPQGEGSCVHATMVSLFNWNGMYDMANWWKSHNGDGEWDDDLAAKFNRAGVRFAYTSEKGDIGFLEWACSTRRGCGVTVMGGRHMVALVHFDKKWAGILDNNQTGKIIWVPRATFVAEWLNSNSWAVTPVYSPSPPMPAKS